MSDLSSLVRGLAGPAWVIAPRPGRLLAANPAGLRLLGIPAGDLAGSGGALDRAMPAVRRLTELETTTHGEQHVAQLIFWGQGGQIALACRCRRVDTEAGQPAILVVATEGDTPAGHGAADGAAASAIATMIPLLAELAHELRTPLGATLALAEIMRDERFGPLGNPRYRDYAADIYRSTRHVLAVLNAMLDRDSAARGRQMLEFHQLDLAELAAHCVVMVQTSSRAAAVKVTLAPGGRLPHVIADARTVRQMILNLLANAIEHSPPDGEVRLVIRHEAAGTLAVSVEDEGPGLAPDRPSGAPIASPANTHSATQPAEAKGTGIGLPLVRALAAVNGAELILQSKGGAGTLAVIRFARDRVVPV